MAQQIKKKYLLADSVDGTKLKLLQGQAIRGVDENGQAIDLLKIDSQGKAIVDGAEVAFKSQVDGLATQVASDIQTAVAAESSARQTQDGLLSGRLDTLEANSSVAGSVDYKVKQAVDDLVDGAPGTYDTLKEIADYISSDGQAAGQMTTQLNDHESRLDTIEGSGVGSFAYADTQLQSSLQSAINTAVNGETTARQTADGALDGRLSTLEGQNLNSRLGTLEADPVTKTYVNNEVDAVETRVGVLEGHNLDNRLDVLEVDPVTKTYVDGINSSLGGRLSTLEADPVTKAYVDAADAVLDGRLDVIQGSGAGSISEAVAAEAALRQAADDALDGRLDTLEGNSSVAGSVDYKVKAQIDALVNSASSAYDTLKEIEDYITSDVAAAAQVTSQLGSLDGRITTIEGSGAGSFAYADSQLQTSLTSAITQAVSTEASARQTADNALDVRIDALESDPAVEYQIAAAAGYTQQGVAIEYALQDAAPLVIDGITIAQGEKVLLHGQVNWDKGVYEYAESNGQYTLTKVVDASFIVGKKFYIQKGNVFANSTWVLGAFFSGQPMFLISAFKPFHVPASLIPFDNSVVSVGTSAKRWLTGYFGTLHTQDIQPYTVTMQEGGKISNLSSGTASGDAVNKGQLDAINSALDARIDALEEATDGPQFFKEKIVLGSGDLSYIDLDHQVIAESIVLSVGRLMGHKDEDFTVSVVNGKTRLTWAGSFASPGGDEAVEEGDSVFVTYAVLA